MRWTGQSRVAPAILSVIWLAACSGKPAEKPAQSAPAREAASAPAPNAPAPNAPAPSESAAPAAPGAPAPHAPSAPPAPSAPRVVCLGDSLTAGYGLPSPDEAYPALLERKLASAGLSYEVINAGVSGDTSAGGLRRLDWSLQGDVRVLVIALGGNDGLRGLPPAELRANLDAIIKAAEARHIRVLLLGMEAPPNFGDRYTQEFRAVYRDLARQHHVAFIPFFLTGVAGIDGLNQGDGIHPTAEGQQKIADLIWPVLKPLVEIPRTS
jgi:acyl-CoA thioesterase I